MYTPINESPLCQLWAETLAASDAQWEHIHAALAEFDYLSAHQYQQGFKEIGRKKSILLHWAGYSDYKTRNAFYQLDLEPDPLKRKNMRDRFWEVHPPRLRMLDAQEIDDAVYDLMLGKISKCSLFLQKNDAFYLDFKRKDAQNLHLHLFLDLKNPTLNFDKKMEALGLNPLEMEGNWARDFPFSASSGCNALKIWLVALLETGLDILRDHKNWALRLES
ncbi:MAG: hypothetical protein KGS48_11290 [Bacteroidetes bacterium]|nr:hypothetical protein [Bacteroidota bacterium]